MIRAGDIDAELRRDKDASDDLVNRAGVWLYGLISGLKPNGANLPLSPEDVERLRAEIQQWQAAAAALLRAVDDAADGAGAIDCLTDAQRAQLSFQRHYRQASFEGVPEPPPKPWMTGGQS